MKLMRNVLVGAAAVWLAASAALAGGAEEHLRHLPADVDVVVTLRDAELADWAFFSGLAGSGDVATKAWAGLGAALGIEEAEAFEQLAGRRASVAVRGAWTEESDWVVLLTVEEASAERFKRAFHARPRKIVGGRPVMSLGGAGHVVGAIRENGRVVLALTQLGGGDGSGALFESVLAGGERNLAESDRGCALSRLGEAARYTAALRLPLGKGWLVCGTAGLEETTQVRLVGRLREAGDPAGVIEPGEWAGILEGSLFGVVERTGSLADLRGGGLPEGLESLLEPALDAMTAECGETAALVIRADAADGAAIGAAMSAARPIERARTLDRAASRTLARLGQAMGQGAWEHDFLGLAPRAWRRASFENGFEIAWVYVGGEGERGWVAASTSDAVLADLAATASLAGDVAVFGGDEGDEAWSWRSIGQARPAALVELIVGKGGEPPAMLEGLARMELVEWGVRDRPGGRLEGEITMRRTKAADE